MCMYILKTANSLAISLFQMKITVYYSSDSVRRWMFVSIFTRQLFWMFKVFLALEANNNIVHSLSKYADRYK